MIRTTLAGTERLERPPEGRYFSEHRTRQEHGQVTRDAGSNGVGSHVTTANSRDGE
jgi:hypothetical protein